VAAARTVWTDGPGISCIYFLQTFPCTGISVRARRQNVKYGGCRPVRIATSSFRRLIPLASETFARFHRGFPDTFCTRRTVPSLTSADHAVKVPDKNGPRKTFRKAASPGRPHGKSVKSLRAVVTADGDLSA